MNPVRPENEISNNPSKQPLPVPRRSVSNSVNSYESETAKKRNNLSPQIKTKKPSGTRAAPVKQREGIREHKQNNGNNLVAKQKSHPNPSTDDKENDISKSKRNKNLSQSVPRQHTIRRNDFETEDDTTVIDDDNSDVLIRNKSTTGTELSDTTRKKNPPLPPVRRGQGPPAHDPALTYPLPYGHPLQGRYPYYDGYQSDRQQHDAYDDLPDLATYPVDPEKRQTKSKSEKNENENGTFETSPQEKNGDSKKILKSPIHDTVYSHHWKSTGMLFEKFFFTMLC